MPRTSPTRRLEPARRPLALFALAIALLTALPCVALAAEESCCGAASSCSIAAESPCAQLAASPCCEAGGAPLEGSAFVPRLDAPATCPLPRVDLPAEIQPLAAYCSRAVRPEGLAQRSVILRL